MQDLIIKVIEIHKKQLPCWVFQRELFDLVQKHFKITNKACFSTAIRSMRNFDELEFKKIDSSNYAILLKKIDRKDMLEKRNIFKNMTFVYRIK